MLHVSSRQAVFWVKCSFAPASVVESRNVPNLAGVYAVYDSEETLRYIGVSRNISMTVQSHSKVMGDAVSAIRASTVENATKDDLIEAWKAWLQEAVDATGKVPPGNAEEKEQWQPRRKPAAKAELKLTPGKGVEDLTCSISDLIEAVVKSEKVVAFIKGTRTQPQCGFSYQMLTTLNGLNTDYQVVNVLDELYNPGLREAIKEYSAWPTIPQLYVNGDFVGGSDIVQEMAGNGELASVLNGSD